MDSSLPRLLSEVRRLRALPASSSPPRALRQPAAGSPFATRGDVSGGPKACVSRGRISGGVGGESCTATPPRQRSDGVNRATAAGSVATAAAMAFGTTPSPAGKPSPLNQPRPPVASDASSPVVAPGFGRAVQGPVVTQPQPPSAPLPLMRARGAPGRGVA